MSSGKLKKQKYGIGNFIYDFRSARNSEKTTEKQRISLKKWLIKDKTGDFINFYENIFALGIMICFLIIMFRDSPWNV